MKNLRQTLKQYSFTIFIVIILVLSVGIVVLLNSVITKNIQTINTDTVETTSQPTENPVAPTTSTANFDLSTVERLRSLTPASSVSSAPQIDTNERINPFAE